MVIMLSNLDENYQDRDVTIDILLETLVGAHIFLVLTCIVFLSHSVLKFLLEL